MNLKKTLLYGLIIGTFSGSIVSFYRYALSIIEKNRINFYNLNFIIILIISFIIGLIVAKLLQYAKYSGGSGIPQIKLEKEKKIETDGLKVSISKFFGGAISSVVGLSFGREGPSIQLGGAFSKYIAQKLKINIEENSDFLIAGACAGLSAAFSAPISSVIFLIEEINVFKKSTIIMAFVSSVVADFISVIIFGLKPVFDFSKTTDLTISLYFHIFLLAILVSIFGILFNKLLLKFKTIFNDINIANEIKIAFSFMIIALIGLKFFPILGSGISILNFVTSKKYNIYILLLIIIAKILLTCFSYSTGAQGGIFLPILSIGGICGVLYFTILNKFGFISDVFLPNFIIIGMCAILSSVVRTPMLAVLLIFELNGNINTLLALSITSMVSYFFSYSLGSIPIYESLAEAILEKDNKKK
ncbi:MAG: ClC family H(+)/Cl(-) exchange transporter [Peptoniphilaceae bacterium]|nr:ClC family H(+)/Cl(-) exchange transporter [Peptoniphilaceae bacterium]MDD7383493.1 ClC family H(+)/Cl(-) exchange transporter [Peptoniphilaceae bacterium]MDY3738666.1 ClC family H(+)/Cl(-) exchange transporter [Peptoniphilaceae bacterium]